jgi:acyl carrier protein
MADVLDLNVDAIDDDTSADNTPNWGSANHIQLVLALEEEFSMSFDVAEIEAMVSFPAIVQALQSKL